MTRDEKNEIKKRWDKKNRAYWDENDPYEPSLGPKRCCRCKQIKQRTEFARANTNKDGLQAWCSSCRRERHVENPALQMLVNARQRAQKHNLPFDITVDDIIVPDVCPILGIPIVVGHGATPNSPSLDRIEPHLGYVKGNVLVISHRANTLKSDATVDELLAVAAFLRDYFEKKYGK